MRLWYYIIVLQYIIVIFLRARDARARPWWISLSYHVVDEFIVLYYGTLDYNEDYNVDYNELVISQRARGAHPGPDALPYGAMGCKAMLLAHGASPCSRLYYVEKTNTRYAVRMSRGCILRCGLLLRFAIPGDAFIISYYWWVYCILSLYPIEIEIMYPIIEILLRLLRLRILRLCILSLSFSFCIAQVAGCAAIAEHRPLRSVCTMRLRRAEGACADRAGPCKDADTGSDSRVRESRGTLWTHAHQCAHVKHACYVYNIYIYII